MGSIVTPQKQLKSSAASRLPPELTDAIIDAGKDDKPFLKTCSFVCRAWVPASRRQLFRRIVLHNRDLDKFDQLMQSELVTIPRHIRHLEIRPPPYQHVLENTRLLSQFPFVEYLLEWLEFRVHIGPGIGYFRSLTQLRIHYCKFNSFDDLADILRSCVILEDLSLVNVRHHASESHHVAGSLPSLRRLAIQLVYTAEDVLAWLLFLHPVPALHSFTFHYDGTWTKRHMDLLNAILQNLGPSLHRLDLDEGVMFSAPLDLSHNTHLQTLTLGLVLPYSSTNVTVIKSVLGPVGSSIQVVVFNASIWYDDGSQDFMALQELDRFLCQPQFQQLRAIRFRIYDDDEDEAKSMIELNMAGSLSRGILSITDSTR